MDIRVQRSYYCLPVKSIVCEIVFVFPLTICSICEQLLSKLSLLGPCNLSPHFLPNRLYNATVCVTCGLVALQWKITRWSASCCISGLCNITRSRSTCRSLAANQVRSYSRLYNATVCVTCGLVAMQWEITRWSTSCCISMLCNITRSRSTCRPLPGNQVFSAPPFDQVPHIVLWYCGCCRGPVRPTSFSVMGSELVESIRSAVIGHPPLFCAKGCHLRSRAYERPVLDQRCETMHLNKKNILTCLCHSVCNISVYIRLYMYVITAWNCDPLSKQTLRGCCVGFSGRSDTEHVNVDLCKGIPAAHSELWACGFGFSSLHIMASGNREHNHGC